MDTKELREELEGKSSRAYWKGLDHLAETDEYKRWAGDEFPHRASLPDVDRRSFLKLMGASLMLAGLTISGCRRLPQEKIVPFVKSPEDSTPGQQSTYATAAILNGAAIGLLVTSNEGRPTKIDGNPKHPASLGACDARTQASILNLYDPDRLKAAQFKGEVTTWQEFLTAIRKTLTGNGDGFALLTETVNSPALAFLIAEFLAKYPGAKHYTYEPVNRDNVRDGSLMAFGKDLDAVYSLDKAKVVFSLDSSLFQEERGSVRYMRDLMSARNATEEKPEMARVYAAESCPTLLGAIADHRKPLRAGEMLALAQAVAGALGVPGSTKTPADKWVQAAAEDLRRNMGASLVVCGAHLPAELHALVHAINEHLGNVNKTVVYIEPVSPVRASHSKQIADLAAAIQGNSVKALLVLGGNPAYSAPADLDLGNLIGKVPLSAHLGPYVDATSTACQWQLPESHFLEAWGDARAYDGTLSIVQPLIEPLYDSKSALELLDALMGRSRPGYDVVRDVYKRTPYGSEDFESKWNTWLSDGIVTNTQTVPVSAVVSPGLAGAISAPKPSNGLEVVFAPDSNIHDGRYGNNGWLQELPKAITNLTWDNAVYMSTKTAQKLGVTSEDRVRLTVDGRSVEAPVLVVIGHADDALTVHLGYGQTQGGQVVTAGAVGQGGGFNAYTLRTSSKPFIASDVEVKKLGGKWTLANTQLHNTIDVEPIDSERDIIRSFTLNDFINKRHLEGKDLHHGEGKEEVGGKPPSLYNDKQHENPEYSQWAMTVDLNLCTGCNACVVACQSENNIPVVGKEQVIKGREMHWIRIDRYYGPRNGKADLDNPPIYFQPVNCMHCENAPCEPVCPVAATVHSREGLNQMVYNRCVGTRYCSNNCPYKVRRFNFLNYGDYGDVPVLKMIKNPEVTVRSRGVMEKCTYCVQRINKARIEAKKDGRPIKDGEVRTACQSACPSNAIVFGDKSDPNSAVSALKKNKRHYVLLEELNTRPRTTYLARLTNPNPEAEA